MSTEDKVEHAICDPTADYDTPMAVVEDAQLTAEQKLRILKSWRKDAELLATAQEENMTGGERPQLQDVSLALQTLHERTRIDVESSAD